MFYCIFYIFEIFDPLRFKIFVLYSYISLIVKIKIALMIIIYV